MDPAEGERRAAIGFAGQYGLAARVVYEHLSTLEWIHLADPDAGIADDFQFKAGASRHALQVKWSQYPESFTWGALTGGSNASDALIAGLARAWTAISKTWDGPLTVHLCTNGQPSVTPPTSGSVLASASIGGPKHLAAFLARSFLPAQRALRDGLMDMGGFRQLPLYQEWMPFWAELVRVTGLGDDDFLRFVEALEFNFGVPPLEDGQSTLVSSSVDAQMQKDLRFLAGELQACVADPARPRRIDRGELLRRLDWETRLRFKNRHEFPVPGTYTPNRAAATSLHAALDSFAGGYLALVGPAGSGKSTLLSDIAFEGRVIRYYAFVPDSPNPLGHRGEAESFLNDLSLALEEGGIRRTGQPSGLPGLRHCVERQLARAQEAWRERGEKTVIVIDGLDHIPREQTPSRSMLEELPSPAGLGDGVFIVLGTQTTAVVGSDIRGELAGTNRTVTLPPLEDDEVRELASQAGLVDWMWPGQVDSFVEVVEGHPLAATYLLQELGAVSASDENERRADADRILSDASNYRGDIELRYRGYFQAVQAEPDVVALLASVARLRTSLNLQWLATWASGDAVSRFVARTKTFFRVDDDEWQFVHNSFRRFLSDETSRVDGVINERRDQELHLELANRCADSGESWPIFRDEEVAHRYLAGDDARVLAVVSPDAMRAQLRALHPSPVIQDHTNLGLRAAARSGNHAAFVNLSLFTAELVQREQAFRADQLAEAVASIGSVPNAVDYVVRGSRIRISPNIAVGIAAIWAENGDLTSAARVLNALGGVAALNESRVSRSSETDGMAEWAVATFYVSGLDAVLGQLERHVPLPEKALAAPLNAGNGEKARNFRAEREVQETRHQRLEVLAACFDELLELRDFDQLDRISALIDAEGDLGWRARGRLTRAMAAAADGDLDQAVLQVQEMLDLERPVKDRAKAERVPLGFRLRAAVVLVSVGLSRTATFANLVNDEEVPAVDEDSHGQPEAIYRQLLDFETVRDYIALSNSTPTGAATTWLSLEDRKAKARRQGQASPPTSSRRRDAGRNRLLGAVGALARLRAEAIAAREGLVEAPTVAGRADDILQLIEVPRQAADDWTAWYRVREAFPSLVAHLVQLAHRVGGSAELSRLTGVLDRAWSGERAKYWSVEYRHAALEEFAKLDTSSHGWIGERLDDVARLIANRSFDPETQVQAWLKQAAICNAVGRSDDALAAIAAGVDASLGLGMTDDDEQVAQWMGWLTAARSNGAYSDEDCLDAIDRFAARLPQAAQSDDRAAATAAKRLVRECWQISPMHGYRVGISLSDIGVLPELDLFAAAILGSQDVDANGSVQMSALVATEVLLPAIGRDEDQLIERLRAMAPGPVQSSIDRAVQTWALVDEPSERESEGSTLSGDSPTAGEHPSTDEADMPEVPSTAASLLGELRRMPEGTQLPKAWWDAAVDDAFSLDPPYNVAQALVEQLCRLRSTEHALGVACGALARVGGEDAAQTALQIRLSGLSSSGWFRHYDGGSRRKLFAGAMSGGSTHGIASLALTDFAECLAGGILGWGRFAEDVRQILDLVAGPVPVANAWPAVEAYLDLVAPCDSEFQLATLGARAEALEDTCVSALAALIGDYLGHPTKVPEEGARRVLIRTLADEPSGSVSRASTLAVLEDAVRRGGWPAESGLTVLALAAPADPPESLVEAVEAEVSGKDQILRDLALRVCALWGRTPSMPDRRALSGVYQMAFASMPTHLPPEVDAEGIPFVDVSDPQQVVAPFNKLLEVFADHAGLSASSMMHRASQLALTPVGDAWTDNGHRAMSDRLKRRSQRHIYRPWAYLVGRRAAGQVLADLVDAGIVPEPYPSLAFELLAPDLVLDVPGPISDSMPRPWRPASTSSYDTRGWCDEVEEAAAHYRTSVVSAGNFLLAEVSDWASLEWGLPEEKRRLLPMQVRGRSALGSPITTQSVEGGGSAYWYPDGTDLDWDHKELIVRGWEMFNNAPYLRWIALHPHAASALGWRPIDGQRFAWEGADGKWRARTDYLARGLLSHGPPAHSYVAEGWQVFLSREGRAEVEHRFGSVDRRLTVLRKLPANRREETDEVRSTARIDL